MMNFKKIWNELILEMIFIFSMVLTIILFYKNNLLTAFLLALISLVGLKLWHKKDDVYFFVIPAFIGPTFEIICIYFGVWRYANPTLAGIPIYLPIAYGLALLVLKNIITTFLKMERN